MKQDTIIQIIKVLAYLLLMIALGIIGSVLSKKFIRKEVQTVVYQIDTAKVQVLYEDTWGKILFVKEEDL